MDAMNPSVEPALSPPPTRPPITRLAGCFSAGSSGWLPNATVGGATVAVAWMLVLFASSDWRAPSAFPWILLADGSLAAMWLTAALGFGALLVRLTGLAVALSRFDFIWISWAVGVALLAAADNALGSVAWLGGLSVVLVVAGIMSLFGGFRTAQGSVGWPDGLRQDGGSTRLTLTVLPVAALLAAAASAPGWLWPTEFGGYDALAYHLQCPREWMEAGRIQPAAHNAYSFLPNWIESSFLHLMLLKGSSSASSAWGTAVSCQFLCAGITVIAAGATGSAAGMIAGSGVRGIARGLVLATPWVVVTGSMAYTECGVILGCALAIACMALIARGDISGRISLMAAAFAGLGVALAIGSKASSVALVALPLAPLAMACLASCPSGTRARLSALALAAIVVPLAPWLARNAMAIGNPLFPFAVGIFGSGSPDTPLAWTTEECARFASAHHDTVSPWGRLTLLWDQWFRFGFGRAPNEDPWLPQWGPMPWLFALGAIVAWSAAVRRAAPRLRWLSVGLALQLALWMGVTHMHSRFLMPTVVVGAVLASPLLLAIAGPRVRATTGPRLMTATLTLLSAFPAVLLIGLQTSPVKPLDFVGGEDIATGALVGEMLRAEAADRGEWLAVADQSAAPFVLNEMLQEGTRALLVGEAAPFWVRGPFEYATVWDGAGLMPHGAASLPTPEDWIDSLRARDIKAVLVDEAMLRRWRLSGWLHPAIDPDDLDWLFSELQPLASTRSGTLYAVPEPRARRP